MTVPPLQRLLLVEDEPDIQMIARMALESVGGLVVEVCSSGREALEKAPAFAPDLVVLDVMMPGMDGPATLQALRQQPQFSGVPVLFMTAKVQAHEVAQLKALGALEVIAKPFDPMTLAADIKKYWLRHHS